MGCTHLSRNLRWGSHWGFPPCPPPDPLPSGYTRAPLGLAPVHAPPLHLLPSPPRSTAHPVGSHPSSPCTLHSRNSRGSWAAAGTSVLPSSSSGALASTGSPARTPVSPGIPGRWLPCPGRGPSEGPGRSGVDEGLRSGWKSWGDAGSPSPYREGSHVLSRCVSGGGGGSLQTPWEVAA